MLGVLSSLSLIGACGSPTRDFGGHTGGIGGSIGGGASGASAGSGGLGGEAAMTCTPGATKDCYASADGKAFAGGKPPALQTTCRLGQQKCGTEKRWGDCLGAIGPEAADTCEPGNDANCNGKLNEGCACADGDTRACGITKGNCQQGTQTCTASVWGDCVGEVRPAAADTCDDKDDANCNGTPNEGCGCINGTMKECGTDVGPCEFGKVTCANGVYAEAACVGGVKPAAKDTCDTNNDANCNGTPNEGCSCNGSGTSDCGLDVGTCKKGKQACQSGALGVCMGGVTPTTNDTCFAADVANDTNCNGKFRDGCVCVATDPPASCGDPGCGSQTCNGATGKLNACAGDNKTTRCNPNAPDSRQICGASGGWVANNCRSGSVCRNATADCKLLDGQTCVTSTDCASSPCNVFNLDADNDGYRANGTAVKFCGSTKSGYVLATASKGDDCNDANVDIHPGATEVCDGIDNDCDGKLDMLGNPTLKLSGTVKTIGSGSYSSVGSLGTTYGVVFTDSGNASTSFEIIDQTATVKAGSKVTLDSAGSYPFESNSTYPPGGSLSPPAMTWDGTNLSIFFLLGYSDLYFRQATATGLVNQQAIYVSSNAAGYDAFAQKTSTGSWFYHAWRSAYQTANIYYVPFNGASGPVMSTYLPTGTLFTGMALSGTAFGIVNHNYAASPQTIEFSTRNSSGSIITPVSALATSVDSQARPAIAARAGGGFAIIYGDSGNLFYQERTVTGTPICGPIYLASASFLPVQLVPTSRGYLAVSAAAGTVKAQEIVAGCTWGVSLPNIGPGADDSGYATSKTHIAAGNNGFAMVWDLGSEIHARTFGTNFCD